MKLIYFTIFSVFSSILLGQKSDTSVVISGWKLTNNYTTSEIVSVDTNLLYFDQYNPIYKYSSFYSSLGNLGSPVISNIFTDRKLSYDVNFLNYYSPYFYLINNTNYFSSRKPVSYLTYSNGDEKNNKQESLEVFLSENITPKLNLGLQYHLISSKGQYRYLNVKKNSFRISSNYLGERYKMHSSINFNRYRGDESAGIVDSVFQDTIFKYIKSYPTQFEGTTDNYKSNAQNRIRYYEIGLIQQFKLFTLSSKEDSLKSSESKSRSIAEPLLTYIFKMNRGTKTYADVEPIKPGYYDKVYFNTNNTYDSIANYNVENTLQLDFKTTIRGKVQLGVFGLLGHEYQTYSYFSEWDTTHITDTIPAFQPIFNNGDTLKGVYSKSNFSNVFFTAGFYSNFWNRVKTRFSWNIYYIGPKAGQTSLDGIINTKINFLKHEYEFGGAAKIENKIPTYFVNNYYSNNYIWNSNLLPENKVHLSSFIMSTSNKFELRGNYILLRNFIYYSNLIVPVNYDQLLNFISVEAIKTFQYWEIKSENKLVYQVSDNKSILPLPKVVFYTSTYIDHTFRFKSTGGRLQTMLGVNLNYSSGFKGYAYSPALAQFYLQDNQIIGKYPTFDAFLNVKLKSVRFFVKLENFNITPTNRSHYSVIGYPYKQFSMLFGLSWTFYN